MSCPRCRPRSPAVKTPLEDDDLLGEILLRLPPQPSSLPRASLVCKRWHSITSDRGFFRRFRIHHRRNPPLLGVFARVSGLSFLPTLEAPNRVPPGRFSLQRRDGNGFLSLGCRHGLVLFNITSSQVLVWDPVTGDQHRLAVPPGIATHAEKTKINGAVIRVGDVHFQVVLIVSGNDEKQHRRAFACVYSSETCLWGDFTATPLPSGVPRSHYPSEHTWVCPGKPAVLAGNSIYWMLTSNFNGILQFDLEKRSLAVIQMPALAAHCLLQIVRAEGGGLGLLALTGSILQLWKWKTDCDGVASWALGRTIELNELLSVDLHTKAISVLGFAEENNVVFLWLSDDVFMVHLESLQFKKLFDTNSPCHYHPFESVYTAAIGGGHDAAVLVHHT